MRALRIIVCIKQVPHPDEARVDSQTGLVIREGVPMVLNPNDYFAIEEALRLKETWGGEVVALTMGPPGADAILREAISLGVDDGVLLSHPSFAGADTLATAYTLARGIECLGGYDLILTGSRSTDGETGQVGPQIAEILGIPHLTELICPIDIEGESLLAWHQTDYGQELVQMPLPALLTAAKGMNEPRLPSLRGKMRAKKQELPIWGPGEIKADPDRIGLAGSPTCILQTALPERGTHSKMLEGSMGEQIDALLHHLEDILPGKAGGR